MRTSVPSTPAPVTSGRLKPRQQRAVVAEGVGAGGVPGGAEVPGRCCERAPSDRQTVCAETLTCSACGLEWSRERGRGRKPTVCPTCRMERRPRVGVCALCGARFEPPGRAGPAGYCGFCRSRAGARRRADPSRAERQKELARERRRRRAESKRALRPDRSCAVCGGLISGSESPRRMLCRSNACRNKASRLSKSPAALAAEKRRSNERGADARRRWRQSEKGRATERAYESRPERRAALGKAKRRRARRASAERRLRRAAEGTTGCIWVAGPCVICSAPFVMRQAWASRTCSAACARRWRRRSGGSHRRRARYYGAPYVPINSIEIFERDSWVCGICGGGVNRAAVAPEPDAPTVDHVVALSVPGTPGHVPSNVQCAHFMCNSIKGAGLLAPEQLRLVG